MRRCISGIGVILTLLVTAPASASPIEWETLAGGCVPDMNFSELGTRTQYGSGVMFAPGKTGSFSIMCPVYVADGALIEYGDFLMSGAGGTNIVFELWVMHYANGSPGYGPLLLLWCPQGGFRTRIEWDDFSIDTDAYMPYVVVTLSRGSVEANPVFYGVQLY